MRLVDASVWIDLLREHDTRPVAKLRQLLTLGLASVAPVVIQELLQGAADPRSLAVLRERFNARTAVRRANGCRSRRSVRPLPLARLHAAQPARLPDRADRF